MSAISNKKIVKIGSIMFTEVPRDRVRRSLMQFKRRVEHERQKEAPLYSFPSDKTRIRILE